MFGSGGNGLIKYGIKWKGMHRVFTEHVTVADRRCQLDGTSSGGDCSSSDGSSNVFNNYNYILGISENLSEPQWRSTRQSDRLCVYLRFTGSQPTHQKLTNLLYLKEKDDGPWNTTRFPPFPTRKITKNPNSQG